MDKHKLFAFVGPTGSGKTTLIRELAKAFPDDLEEVVSLTTRPRRCPEDDQAYRFVTPGRLREKNLAGKLIQMVEYAGHYYANDRDDLDRLLRRKHGLIALTEQGVHNFMDANYDVLVIRVIPENCPAQRDTIRIQADEVRAKLDIPVHIEVLNSFSLGGLESAVEELIRLVKRIVNKKPPQT